MNQPHLLQRLLVLLFALSLALPAAVGQEEDEESPVFELSPFEVRTDRQYGYRAGTSVSGTRIATEVRQLPFSLSVVTDELINDMKVTDLEDAVRYAPGVQDNRDNLGNYGKFNVRGIQQTYSLRNGFRRYGPNDTSAAAQVELVKGPAGLLYGQVFPGGVVNVVTKKPLTIPNYEVEFRYGNYGSYRVSTDLGGPINADKTLNYRLISAYEDWESFVQFYGRRVKTLVPSVEWRPTDWLTLTVEVERYIREERSPHAGMIAINREELEQAIANPDDPFGVANGPFNPRVVRSQEFTGLATYLPRDFNTNGPGTYSHYDSYSYNLYTDIKATDWLSFRSVVLYYDYNKEYYANFINNAMRSGVDFRSRANKSLSGNEVFQTQNDFSLQFQTGPIDHQILLGGEYYRDHFSAVSATERPTDPDSSAQYVRLPNPYEITRDWALEFRFINPILDFSRSPRPEDLREPDTSGNRETDGYAFYFTDQMTLMDERLRLLGGARYERFETEDYVTGNKDDEDEVTFQGGFLYNIVPAIGIFGSYSESFYRNEFYGQFGDPARSGELIPPQRGDGIDFGIKFESPGGKWSGTLSFFDLSQTNIPVTLSDESGNPVQKLAGERTSTGVEADFHIAPGPGWQIKVSYAYTDAEDALSGQEFPNVPKHQGSVWTRYEFLEGPLEALFLGGGAVYMGDRPAGNDSNIFGQGWNFTAESYVAVDFFVGKAFSFGEERELEVQFNVKNLTDEDYIRGGQTLPSEPRRYLLTLAYRF